MSRVCRCGLQVARAPEPRVSPIYPVRLTPRSNPVKQVCPVRQKTDLLSVIRTTGFRKGWLAVASASLNDCSFGLRRQVGVYKFA